MARETGGLIVEGFHYLFHPVTRRLLEIAESGRLGRLTGVDVVMAMPEPADGDPRWSLDLAGGVIGESLSDDAKAKGVVDRFLADLEKAK